jgi:hypothetical protein
VVTQFIKEKEMSLDLSIEPIEGHEGQRYMIYSKTMRCEIPREAKDVPEMLGKMFLEYLDLLDVEIPGKRRFRVLLGTSPSEHHSYRDFYDLDDALAFLWAMAHSPCPSVCWFWQGMDGWMNNKHMAGKAFPVRIKDLCQFYLDEDKKATYEQT